MKLFKELKWNRFAALTEDGQKYTEYISYMENYLKENGISLISNEKFPTLITPSEMNDVYKLKLQAIYSKYILML